VLKLIVGVYKIVCLINNKLYIGSSYNIKNRISIHKYKLRANKHENIHLQRAWNKYGEDNFKFEEMEECSIEVLRTREQYWIDSLKVCDINIGYNICNIVGKPGAKIDVDTVIKIKYNILSRTALNIRNLIDWRECLFELNEKITSFRTDIGKNKTLKMLKMRSHCEKCGEVIYKTNNKQKFCSKCRK